MYGKGGWVVSPKRKLPVKKLSKKQLAENAKAAREWDEKNARANAELDKFLRGLADTYGASVEAEAYIDFKLPHAEGEYDKAKFTKADRAVFDYFQTGRYWNEDSPTLRALRRVVTANVPVEVVFSGGSRGGYDDDYKKCSKDGPEIPDWLKKALR